MSVNKKAAQPFLDFESTLAVGELEGGSKISAMVCHCC